MTTVTTTLNQGQQRAAEGFFNFLFSKDNELIISGPGGVGKTFLMGHLIDTIMPRYEKTCRVLGIPPLYHQVMMTATTNKAAEVLGRSTGRPAKTIHSFLKLKVTEDYENGVTRLIKTPDWKVHENYILFVDEASMIDHKLLTLLREGTHQTKIVYVGDHCQLAPVMEEISPIYTAGLPFFELTEPMRNAEQPALMDICTQLRATVERSVGPGKFRPIKTVPGVIDLLDEDGMLHEIKTHFKSPSNHDRILAFTNKRVMQYNDHIREIRGLPARLTEGERVINNSAISRNGVMMSVEAELLVTEVASKTEKVELESGVFLEVVRCSLASMHTTFNNVPVPVDRTHFHALTRYYANEKNWTKYYHLKNNYPDLRPRDAATVHKAQGSTYDTVFLDLDDLSTCPQPDMAARLLYVAFSRARHRVVLYGKLAPRFGGIIT